HGEVEIHKCISSESRRPFAGNAGCGPACLGTPRGATVQRSNATIAVSLELAPTSELRPYLGEHFMKAMIMDRHGGPDILRFGDLPDPTARVGEVVVDVHAASINGADIKVLEGTYAPIATFPYVLGRDFSGVVSALGDGVGDFKVGDAVFGVLAGGRDGTFQEKVA